MSLNSIMLVTITCDNLDEAMRIRKYLLDNKYIASGHIAGVDSLWLRKGDVQESEEFELTCRTLPDYKGLITEYVMTNLDDDLPEILFVEVETTKEIKNWVIEELKK